MRMATALLLSVSMISLAGCKNDNNNIEKVAQRFRNIDFDPNSTYKMFNAWFGAGDKYSCGDVSGFTTVDCSMVAWPKDGHLIDAMFHAQFQAGFSHDDWLIDDSALPVQVEINRHFLGKVCGVRFIFGEQTICGQRAFPLKLENGTVWGLRWPSVFEDGNPRSPDNAIRRIGGGLFTPMPPPQVFEGSRSGSPRLTIENRTQYPIQVYLSGPEPHSVTVLAGESLILDLHAAGAFKFAAEVINSSVSPFYGEQTFNNGTAYVEKIVELVR